MNTINFKEWFKKNIFEACYVDLDCFGMKVFGIFFDFRCWYEWNDDLGYYQSEEECKTHIKEVEKKNVKRKNKLPIPTYSRIPWYVTITDWKSLRYRSRKFGYFLVGFILGFIVKGLI